MSHGLAVYAFTPQGLGLAAKALGLFEAERGKGRIYAPRSLQEIQLAEGADITWFDSLPELIKTTFHLFPAHLFIAATGIAVRAVAPHIRSKTTDPAVLVMDQKGAFVISLLSGHLGGANELAAFLAAGLGATPVITTATDAEGLPSLDVLAQRANLAMPDMDGVKRFSAALIAGKPVRVEDSGDLLGLAGIIENAEFPVVTVRVTHETASADEVGRSDLVLLHPKVLHAGIGCRRGTPAQALVDFVRQTFAEEGLALESLAACASFEAKADEAGLVEAAKVLGAPLCFFAADALSGLPVTVESPKAREVFDLAGVAEPAALASAAAACRAGSAPRLLLPKQKGQGITLAIALTPLP